MLGKLLKYEFQATGRVLLPIYAGILILAVITNVFLHINIGVVGGVMASMYGLLCFAMIVVTLIIAVQRFERNLLGDEGYLMFTLPTTEGRLIWSKLIVAFIWVVVGSIVGALSGMIIALDAEMLHSIGLFFAQFGDQIRAFFAMMSATDYLFLFELLLIAIVSGFVFYMTIYLSLAVAQLPQFAKHRRIFGLIAFLAQCFVYGVIISILATSGLFEITIYSMGDAMPILPALWYLIINCLVFTGQFAATRGILKAKLNLE